MQKNGFTPILIVIIIAIVVVAISLIGLYIVTSPTMPKDISKKFDSLIAVGSVGSVLDNSVAIPNGYTKYINQSGTFQFAFPSSWQKKNNPGGGFEFIVADIQGKIAPNTIYGYSYKNPTFIQLFNEKRQLSSNPTLKFAHTTTINSIYNSQKSTTTILPFVFIENGQEKYGAVIMIDSSKGKFGITYMANSAEFSTYFPDILASFRSI